MAVKFVDTIKGWEARGYKVTAAALDPKRPLTNTMVNRDGHRLYSWGEVIPKDYKDRTIK